MGGQNQSTLTFVQFRLKILETNCISCFVPIIIIISFIIHSLELFTSAIADGFSLKSEWQQVSSSLQDSSSYSGSSQQCCRLDGLHSSANLQVL